MRVTARTRVPVVAAGLWCALAGTAYATPSDSPANLNVTAATTTTIAIAWDAPSNAAITAAQPYVTSPPSPPYYGGGVLSQTLTTAEFQDLICGTTYTLNVGWIDDPSTAAGPPSSVQGATAPCTKPAPPPPTGLVATPLAATRLGFDWDESSDSDVVKEAYAVNGPLRFVSPVLSPLGTSFEVTKLVCGETYTFSIRWVNDEGQVSTPTSVTAKTLDCSTLGPPGPAPTGFRVTAATRFGFGLAWDAAAGSVIGSRLTTQGPGIDDAVYKRGTGTSVSKRLTAGCGTSYTFTLAWVYSNGSISEPAPLTASTAACPVPQPLPPPAPNALPSDTTPPIVAIRSSRLRVSTKGLVAVPIGCNAEERRCSGTLTLAPAGRPSKEAKRLPAVCGRNAFAVLGGRTTKATIRLRRAALAALRRAGSLRMVLTVRVADAAGNKATKVVKVRLLAPRKR